MEVSAPLLITNVHFRLTLPETWEKRLQPYDRRSLLLGIRPEHLSISPPAPKNLEVEVDLVEALGNDTYLSVHLVEDRHTSLQIRVSPEHQVQVGDSIWLSLALDKIHLFDSHTEEAI